MPAEKCYIIAMKSGARFKACVRDFGEFLAKMQTTVNSGTAAGARNTFYADVSGFMFCIEDISAIYPEAAQCEIKEAHDEQQQPLLEGAPRADVA